MPNLDPSCLCGTNFSYQRYSFDRFLDDMAVLELSRIEIWGIAPHLHVGHVDAADLRSVRKKLAERGLTLVCYTPEQLLYPVNIASEDERLRRDSLTFFHRAAEIASDLQCPHLFVTSGAGRQDHPREPAWGRAADALAGIAERAGRLGVTCVLEALQPRESNLVTTIADLRRMIDEVGSPHLKIALDTVAMAVAGETVEDYTTAFGADIRHAHFIDGTPSGHLAWGDGDRPLEAWLQALARVGYGGALSLEFTAGRYALDPIDPVQRSLERLRAALSA